MVEVPHRRRRPHLLHLALELRRRRPPRPLSGDHGPMAPTLDTARLLLTPVGERDSPPSTPTGTTPQFARWLWDAEPVPLETVADLITRSARTFEQSGWACGPSAEPATPPGSASAASAPSSTPPAASSSSTAWIPPTGQEAWPPKPPPPSRPTPSRSSPSPRSSSPPTTPTTPPSAPSPASAPPRCPASRPAPAPTPLLPPPITRVCSFRAPVAQWIEQRTSNP